MKRLFAILMLLTLAGCKTVTFDIFTHPETHKYQKQFSTDLPKDVFKKHPDLVDSGVLFIPYVRYLGWEPDYRAYIMLYSKEPHELFVHKIIASSSLSNVELTVEKKESVHISSLDEKSGFLKHTLSVFFKNHSDPTKVLESEDVDLTIIYSIGSGTKEERVKVFHLKRKQVNDIAWST